MKILNIFSQFKPYDIAIKHPYIIAEAGVNHEGNIELAKRLIDEAKEGGADAIKFQTYKAETIATRKSPAYWDLNKEPTNSQFELFKKYDKFWKDDYEKLKVYCDQADIEFLSTPFDMESALFLNDLMPVFKISSSDITNKPFIEYICKFHKPIILSNGASYIHEIEEAVFWINKYGNSLALLHCVLNYPTLDRHANLGMILHLRQKFPYYIIGYSDHTLPSDMSVLATATLLGAKILEKHFTYDKKLPGNDHYHAMDVNDLKRFQEIINRQQVLLGKTMQKTPLKTEEISRLNARRSIVTTKSISSQTVIDSSMITTKRPGTGISPKYWDDVIGKIAARDLLDDHILQWRDLVDL